MIEKFINEAFKDSNGNELYCLLNLAKSAPATVSTDVFRTMDCIYNTKKSFLNQQKQTDVVMKSPQHTFDRARLKGDALITKLDL